MNSHHRRLIVLVVIASFGAVGSQARAQFDELVSKVPAAANALVLLNVDKVMSSSAAVKGKWKDEHNSSYSAGLTMLPPNSTSAVLSAHFDLENMHPLWSVAVMSLNHDVSVPGIEAISGGKAEQIGTHAVIKLDGNGYIVQFAPRLVAAIAPATRQSVSRWLREVDSKQYESLSPYLKEAFGYAQQIGTPVILAVDLQDAATVDEIRQSLAASEQYRKADAKQLDQLATLLASIRGITLGITLESEQPYGKVKVDFGESVFLTPEQGRSLLLHALEKRGAMLPELEQWTPMVSARMISLEGSLSPSGVRRISSLFDRPPAFKHGTEIVQSVEKAPPPTAKPQLSSADHVLQASQEYFRRVSELIEDLRKKPQQSTNHSLGSIALWCDTFARKIDQLPSVGVDPELSNYGAFASDTLRSAASAIRDSYARKRIREVNTSVPYDYYTYNNTYGYSARWGWYGAGIVPWGYSGTVAVPDYREYQRERTAIGAEERVTGASQAREVLGKLADATGDLRRKMSEKYNAPF